MITAKQKSIRLPRVSISGRKQKLSRAARLSFPVGSYHRTAPARRRLTRIDPRKRKKLLRQAGFRVNPLKRGYSRKTVSANIRHALKRGRSRTQALAMSLSSARESYRKAHGGKLSRQWLQNPRRKSLARRAPAVPPAPTWGEVTAVVTTMDGKAFASFRVQKDAIQWAKKYARAHKCKLRVIDPR